MKKRLRRLQLFWKNSLIRRNIKLKFEIIRLKDLLNETRKQNHKLIDQKTLDNIRIRELTLEVRKWLKKVYHYIKEIQRF